MYGKDSIDDATGEEWNEASRKVRALDRQVGGGHYKTMGVQPIEMTEGAFGYEGVRASIFTKVTKYLTRDKGDHVENIKKAIHCLQIQLQYAEELNDAQVTNVPVPGPVVLRGRD